MLNANIKIISPDGGDFAYFTEKNELYAKLSGVKDPHGENYEFIEIGKTIYLNNKKLKVIDINFKFENVDFKTSHFEKSEKLMPKNFIIDVVITAEYIEMI